MTDVPECCRISRERRKEIERLSNLSPAKVIAEQRAEIERLTAELIYRNEVIDQRNVMLTHHQSEATCNYCNEYHGREVCAALQADNERLRAALEFIAAADQIHLWDAIKAADEALAAVEDKE